MSQHSLSLKLFIIGILLGFVHITMIAYGKIPVYSPDLNRIELFIKYFVTLSGPFFLWLAVLAALFEGKLDNLKPFYRKWVFGLGGVLLLLLVYGVLVERNSIRFVGYDLMVFSYFFSGILLGSEKSNWKFFDKFFLALFLLSALLSIYAWRALDVLPKERTLYAYVPTYHFWPMLFAWPYFLATICKDSFKKKLIVSLGVSVFFILAVFFLKRAPFFELLVFVLLLVFVFYRQKTNVSKKSLFNVLNATVLLTIVFFCVLFIVDIHEQIRFNKSLEMLDGRFFEKGSMQETVLERMTEETKIISGFSFSEIVLGKGIGSAVPDPSFDPAKGMPRMMVVLSNGITMILLKGGLLFLLVWFAGWFYFLKDFIKNKNPNLNPYYFPVAIVVLLSFLFNFISLHPYFAFLMLCAGACMSSKK